MNMANSQMKTPESSRRRFLRLLGRKAISGDPTSQFYLSVLYEGAHGSIRDAKKSAKWCLCAARSGDVQSQYRAARMLHKGFGVERSLGDALHWLESAAINGHLQAQYDVGLFYFLGVNGCDKCLTKARHYLTLAARRQHPEAVYYLGHMHCNGVGVPRNQSKAVIYYQRAAALGSLRAKCVLAFMYSHGQGVETDVELSARLYEEAASGGHLGAQFGLACHSLANQNYKDAKIWLSLASHNDITPAQAVYAKFLLDGPEEFRDKTQAFMWSLIIRAKQDGDLEALAVANVIFARLQLSLPRWEIDDATSRARDWLERRAQAPLDEETDWNNHIKTEIQFYENQKKRRSF
jgi:hypothetical protein